MGIVNRDTTGLSFHATDPSDKQVRVADPAISHFRRDGFAMAGAGASADSSASFNSIADVQRSAGLFARQRRTIEASFADAARGFGSAVRIAAITSAELIPSKARCPASIS
jgi:hypothetical protein